MSPDVKLWSSPAFLDHPSTSCSASLTARGRSPLISSFLSILSPAASRLELLKREPRHRVGPPFHKQRFTFLSLAGSHQLRSPGPQAARYLKNFPVTFSPPRLSASPVVSFHSPRQLRLCLTHNWKSVVPNYLTTPP